MSTLTTSTKTLFTVLLKLVSDADIDSGIASPPSSDWAKEYGRVKQRRQELGIWTGTP